MTHDQAFEEDLADAIEVFEGDRSALDALRYLSSLRIVRAEQRKGVTTNRDGTVGVDRDYHWLPMATCPRGVKLQLKGRSGVALYAKYDGKDPWWVGWAPLPTEKPNGAT